MARAVIGADFVFDLGARFERAKAMRETGGHEQLRAIVRAQHPRHMAAVAWRTGANVHRHIENGAAHHTHEFGLRKRRCLKMQPTDGPGIIRARMVVLHEIHAGAVLCHHIAPEHFGEKPARIADPLWRDGEHVWNVEPFDLHVARPRLFVRFVTSHNASVFELD